MDKIALVSCVSLKQKGLHKAEELYISDWFIKAKTYIKANYRKWYILSAKHNLVHPDALLEYYEMYLPNQNLTYKKQWAIDIYNKITEYPSCQIDIFAGKEYRKYLVPLLERGGYIVTNPLKNLGIGQQLKWFKERLR